MIKAIVIQNRIILLEHIHSAIIREYRDCGVIKIDLRDGNSIDFIYEKIEDAKTDFMRIAAALNNVNWERKNDDD